eukprot:TRINITY_DN4360_c0_g1_i1.p1 TRINITY_DN4360_c0_g1~~TRINITY_DN4360_c0_g1_i1.p1  ORF type:complete len:161 (-),score=37.25 TRINITY_DN4360_c0_g1_i1:268-750(-)
MSKAASTTGTLIKGAARRLRPTKAILSVTPNAAARVKELISKKNESILGVRIGVRERGCSGLSYTMNYAKEHKKGDELIDSLGVKVFVDPKAIMHLIGTTMDFKEDEKGSEFTFTNPNERGRCGCGESFMTQAMMKNKKEAEKKGAKQNPSTSCSDKKES